MTRFESVCGARLLLSACFILLPALSLTACGGASSSGGSTGNGGGGGGGDGGGGGGGGGASFIVSTTQALGTNGGTTAGINTTGSNFLVACVGHSHGISYNFSDSNRNTWTKVRADVSSGNIDTDLYYVYNPTVGPGHTFSAAATGLRDSVAVYGFSGIAPDPLDQQNGNNSSSNSTSYGPGAMTPGTNAEVWVPCVGTTLNPADSTFTIGTPFTGVEQTPYSDGNYMGLAGAYMIQASAAAETPLFSWTGTSNAQASSGATFISTASTIPSCSGCAYNTASTNSGGSGVVSDPTSLTASVPTGTLFLALGWHTNWSGSGKTTVAGAGGAWHSCKDGSTNPFTDLQVSATVGMSCNYIFTTGAGEAGATIISTDCASTCASLGGIYLTYTGVFIPRAWDAFASNTLAISGIGSNNMTAGAITPSQANDLVVVYCNSGGGEGIGSAGSSPISFTQRQTLDGSAEDAIYNSLSPLTPTYSGSNGVGYGCMTVAFK